MESNCSTVRRRSARLAASRVDNFNRFHVLGWDSMDGQVEGQSVASVQHVDSEVSLGGHSDLAGIGEMDDTIENANGGGEGRVIPSEGESTSTSPSQIVVAQGPGSDSTVSNHEGGSAYGEGSSDVWKQKRSDLMTRLQKAKEREKVLKAQLSVQHERFKLEVQERENEKLEIELAQREEERLARDRDQHRQDILLSERLKLEEEAKAQVHEFELQQARIRAQYEERHRQLEHDIQMRELEIEQKSQEVQLRRKLEETKAHRLNMGQGVGQRGG